MSLMWAYHHGRLTSPARLALSEISLTEPCEFQCLCLSYDALDTHSIFPSFIMLIALHEKHSYSIVAALVLKACILPPSYYTMNETALKFCILILQQAPLFFLCIQTWQSSNRVLGSVLQRLSLYREHGGSLCL